MAFSDLLLTKPTVPDFKPIDVGAEQLKAVGANKSALSGIEDIASKTNTFNQNEMERMLAQAIPGYAAIKSGVSGKILDMISGKIPDDVSAQIQNSGAARAIGGGFAGSGMSRNLVARDLGLTSLDQTRSGISAAQSWLGVMANQGTPKAFDLTSLFVTPGQEIQTDMSNNINQFNRDWMSNQNDAAFDVNTVLGKTFGGMESTVGSLAGAYFGGMLGKAGASNPGPAGSQQAQMMQANGVSSGSSGGL